jgi:hypothetical protein
METVWIKVHVVGASKEAFYMFGTGGITEFHGAKDGGGTILVVPRDGNQGVHVKEEPGHIMSLLSKIRKTSIKENKPPKRRKPRGK